MSIEQNNEKLKFLFGKNNVDNTNITNTVISINFK